MRRIFELDFLPGCGDCCRVVEVEVWNALRGEGTTRITIRATTGHNHSEMLPIIPERRHQRPQDEPPAAAAPSPMPGIDGEAPAPQPAAAPPTGDHPTTLFPMPSPYLVGGVDTQRP